MAIVTCGTCISIAMSGYCASAARCRPPLERSDPVCPECLLPLAQAAVPSAGVLVALAVAVVTGRRPFSVNPEEKEMTHPTIVSRAEWLRARQELLVREKELTRELDGLAAARRALPMVEIDAPYVFDGPHGAVTLLEMFQNRSQLIVNHFMFDPAWDEGCKSCSHFADNYAGTLVHLAARNTSFAAVSRAPIDRIEAFKARMGWTFPWVSSAHNTFNR